MPDTAANHEARTELAVLTTKVEELIREVREYREESKTRDKDHSQRLDKIELAYAEQAHAEKERARIEVKADKVQDAVDSLRKEQRIWTSIASFVAALGNVDISRFLGG